MQKLVKINRDIPLIGVLPFGIIDRGTNVLQVRAISSCNASCTFCSTDAGITSQWHMVQYMVDVDYLVAEVAKVAKIKGEGVIIFLDSVGEPMSHPNFVNLVKGLKKIKEVSEIIVITNGTYLSKDKVDELEKAGLTRINLSLHSLDHEKSKFLFGLPKYDIDKIIEMVKYISKSRIELMLTPVWLPGFNDKDIEEIVQFAKDIGCKVGLQKYEAYKYSRKMKGVKDLNYWKFYEKVRELEKKYGIPLKIKKADLHVEKRPRIPEIFSKGDKVKVDIVSEGWSKGQMIGKAKGRLISINDCNKEIGDRLEVKILEAKNNIYLAK